MNPTEPTNDGQEDDAMLSAYMRTLKLLETANEQKWVVADAMRKMESAIMDANIMVDRYGMVTHNARMLAARVRMMELRDGGKPLPELRELEKSLSELDWALQTKEEVKA